LPDLRYGAWMGQQQQQQQQEPQQQQQRGERFPNMRGPRG
jgi:hypothetical protein